VASSPSQEPRHAARARGRSAGYVGSDVPRSHAGVDRPLDPACEHIKAEREDRPKPECMLSMVSVVVPRFRVDQDRQSTPVQQEPRNDQPKLVGPENDLIHGLRMRSDRLVVSAPKTSIVEELTDALAEEGRFPAAGRWIVVDVRVVRCDPPWILHSCAL
jgi:hypothetical protein